MGMIEKGESICKMKGTMNKLLLLSVLCLTVFVTYAQQHTDALRKALLKTNDGTVLVAAHRAAHAVYPENSLDAIREAIRLGVDIVELDVKVSKDGVPFLLHDRTLDRTTTGHGDPELLTWEELQSLYVVNRGQQTTLKIPTLEEALRVAKDKILIDFDLKTDRMPEVLAVVDKTGTEDMIIFFDSDYNTLQQVKQWRNTALLMPRAHSLVEADSAIQLFTPAIVHIDDSFYEPATVKLLKENSCRIWMNTLNDLDEKIKAGKPKKVLKPLLAGGVNILQTDEPELLLKTLEKMGRRPAFSH